MANEWFANPPANCGVKPSAADANKMVFTFTGTASWLSLSRAHTPKTTKPGDSAVPKYSASLFLPFSPELYQWLYMIAAHAVSQKANYPSWDALQQVVSVLERKNKLFFARSETLQGTDGKFPPGGGAGMIQVRATLHEKTKRGAVNTPALFDNVGQALTLAGQPINEALVDHWFYTGGEYKLFLDPWYMDDPSMPGVWAAMVAMQFWGAGNRVALSGASRIDATTLETNPNAVPDGGVALAVSAAAPLPGTAQGPGVVLGGSADHLYGGVPKPAFAAVPPGPVPLAATASGNTALMFGGPQQAAPAPMPNPYPQQAAPAPMPQASVVPFGGGQAPPWTVPQQ